MIDISAENQRYAQELAAAAGVHLDFLVADFAELPLDRYAEAFDIAFSEGGILHYFSALEAFFGRITAWLAPGGRLILNDFHPLRKVFSPEIGTDGDYFDSRHHERPVAYESNFDDADRAAFPKCMLRYYTLGEMVTALGQSGLHIMAMRELPSESSPKRPAEFIIVARK